MKTIKPSTLASATLSVAALSFVGCQNVQTRPNVILIMADDLGYGDLASYGNSVVKTPSLDQLAQEGLQFSRFYAAAPVCSPTRASCLTGRHPYRTGVPWASNGHIKPSEITIAEALRAENYATGHFGKWHIGSLSKTVKQSYFDGPVDPNQYAPPWENGYDVSFVTESMMPTYNPYYMVGGDYGTEDYKMIQDAKVTLGQRSGGFRWRDFYWTGEGQIVDEWLEGDDSKIIMDRAIDFIDDSRIKKQSFLSVIWFHTPHTPVVASPEHRALYSHLSMEEQHWFGAISAMDEQIGRLNDYLKANNLHKNTILWFCSDNGPSYIHDLNSTGGLRDKKATLYEGGIRVPSILVWPDKIKPGKTSQLAFTSDFYPSLLWATGSQLPKNQPILDGINILEALATNKHQPRSLMFISPTPARIKSTASDNEQFAVIEDQYKLISTDNGNNYQLYDLHSTQHEFNDISELHLNLVTSLKKKLLEWKATF